MRTRSLLGTLALLTIGSCIKLPDTEQLDPTGGDGAGGDVADVGDSIGGEEYGGEYWGGDDVGGDSGTGDVGNTGNTGGSGAGPSGGGDSQAPGVTISEVAFSQGVKKTVMTDGGAVQSGVPILENRSALVRVFVDVESGTDTSSDVARLYLGDSDEPYEATRQSNSSSSDADADSTFNFELDGSLIQSGLTYRVEIVSDSASDVENPGSYYPSSGSESVATEVGPTLKIVVVPIKYGSDGSDRLPDTTSQRLEDYWNKFYAMYPVNDVSITVHASVTWDDEVLADGTGWDELLDSIANLREQDAPADDIFYLGLFAPSDEFDVFCSDGCVTGLGYIGDPSDTWSRAAIGVGFQGDRDYAPGNAAHEVGHNHGRSHVDCGGPAGPDPDYPHANGEIGEWGYDVVTGSYYEPTTADFMSYCDPTWTSDYTYEAILEFDQAIALGTQSIPSSELNRTYHRARLNGDGSFTPLDSVTLRKPPTGKPASVTVGKTGDVVQGHFTPYDHQPGGIVHWHVEDGNADSIQVGSFGSGLKVYTP